MPVSIAGRHSRFAAEVLPQCHYVKHYGYLDQGRSSGVMSVALQGHVQAEEGGAEGSRAVRTTLGQVQDDHQKVWPSQEAPDQGPL